MIVKSPKYVNIEFKVVKVLVIVVVLVVMVVLMEVAIAM
jgi:hypothetical protein